MLSEAEISDALTKRLSDTPFLSNVAWENKSFPVTRPYIDVQIVRVSTTDDTGDGVGSRHRGYMQATVVGELNKWARPNEVEAERIAARFPKALRLSITGGQVKIIRPAAIGQGYRDGADWRLPVRIDYEAS